MYQTIKDFSSACNPASPGVDDSIKLLLDTEHLRSLPSNPPAADLLPQEVWWSPWSLSSFAASSLWILECIKTWPPFTASKFYWKLFFPETIPGSSARGMLSFHQGDQGPSQILLMYFTWEQWRRKAKCSIKFLTVLCVDKIIRWAAWRLLLSQQSRLTLWVWSIFLLGNPILYDTQTHRFPQPLWIRLLNTSFS